MKKYIFFLSLAFLASFPLHGTRYPQRAKKSHKYLQTRITPAKEMANSLENFKNSWEDNLKSTRTKIQSLLADEEHEEIPSYLHQAHTEMLKEKNKFVDSVKKNIFQNLSAANQNLFTKELTKIMIKYKDYLEILQKDVKEKQQQQMLKKRRQLHIGVDLSNPEIRAITGIVSIPAIPH
jgi:hypothetical protein